MVLLGDVVLWNLVSVCWEPVSVQDRCTVGAEHTIGSEIVLDTPDELLGDMGHVETCFSPLGASVGAR